MREWQQTHYKDLVMPDAVYYQTVWAVRDLDRMEKKLKDMDEEPQIGCCLSGNSFSDNGPGYSLVKPTEKRAVEKAVLRMRINAIRNALEMVPLKYRPFVMDSILKQLPYKCFPNNLWRIWKQRFLYNVAMNLEIM